MTDETEVKTAEDETSFTIADGETISCIGSNGAGNWEATLSRRGLGGYNGNDQYLR